MTSDTTPADAQDEPPVDPGTVYYDGRKDAYLEVDPGEAPGLQPVDDDEVAVGYFDTPDAATVPVADLLDSPRYRRVADRAVTDPEAVLFAFAAQAIAELQQTEDADRTAPFAVSHPGVDPRYTPDTAWPGIEGIETFGDIQAAAFFAEWRSNGDPFGALAP